MNIEWAIPCRYVEVHDNLATIVGGGIDHHWIGPPPEVPPEALAAGAPQPVRGVQFGLAVKLAATEEEIEESHNIVSRVRAPDDTVVYEQTAELNVQGVQILQSGWLMGIILPMIVQFPAPSEGTYTCSVLVGNSESTFPVHVVHGFPPGVEAPPD